MLMKKNHEWDPAELLQSPLFAPLHPVLAHLIHAEFPGITDWNNLLLAQGKDICVHSGPALRFVPQEQGRQGFESQYEPRCYLSGEVQTRENNWHDLFNALVWLSFPKAKAAINARHYHALMHVAEATGSQRGKVRDMATLLDESGVIVVCASAELAELLCTFQWKELFWRHREQVCNEMGFYMFGHGLYEKALSPYVGMTGQGLLLHVAVEFFSWSLQAQLCYLDDRVAAYLNNPAHCVSTQELHPVPLLGVPGWSAENNHAEYYDNTGYFRPCRQQQK
jgi:hypothetical protein